jgi:hypothetical protein
MLLKWSRQLEVAGGQAWPKEAQSLEFCVLKALNLQSYEVYQAGLVTGPHVHTELRISGCKFSKLLVFTITGFGS